jgi:hypothetical protein
VFSTVLNEVAALSGAPDAFPWARVLTVVVVFAVAWPLVARLRRTLTARRRARWAADEPDDSERHGSHPGSPD